MNYNTSLPLALLHTVSWLLDRSLGYEQTMAVYPCLGWRNDTLSGSELAEVLLASGRAKPVPPWLLGCCSPFIPGCVSSSHDRPSVPRLGLQTVGSQWHSGVQPVCSSPPGEIQTMSFALEVWCLAGVGLLPQGSISWLKC